jgi:hypothetical protein
MAKTLLYRTAMTGEVKIRKISNIDVTFLQQYSKAPLDGTFDTASALRP